MKLEGKKVKTIYENVIRLYVNRVNIMSTTARFLTLTA